MADESKTVDAVIFSAGWHPGPRSLNAPDAREKYLRAVLGGTPNYKDIPGGRKFVTTRFEDTLLYPSGHALEGQPRYDWVEQANGASHGTLKPEVED